MNLYKNLKTKVYLGLILVLASIPVHASSETWAQNLDLTIPSLEMPSTLALGSRDKQEIMMGFECCWDRKLIEAVKTEEYLRKSIKYSSKVNLKELEFTPQYKDKEVWFAWYLVNVLDVYSTVKGLKYSCIYEANPTLPNVPHRDHLIIHKAFLLSTIFNPDSKYWSDSTINTLSFTIGLAVVNNTKIINEVKNNPNTCPKR